MTITKFIIKGIGILNQILLTIHGDQSGEFVCGS